MNKEFEKFEKEFKKISAKTKNIKTDASVKIRKQLIDALEQAWDYHDDLKEEIADANTQGLSGSKIADYDSHTGFSKAVEGWKKSVAEHKKQIAALKGYHGNAVAKHDELKKKYDAVVKDLTKNKQLKTAPKPVKDTLAAAEAELKRLTEIGALYGSLKVPELFYAAKEDKTLQMIVKKAAAKASGKDLPKILEDAVSKKNIKQAGETQKNIKDAVEKAKEAAGGDPKEAAKQMKLAGKHLDKLKKLNAGYEAAAKKMAKEIAAAPNKKEVEKVIKEIGRITAESEAAMKKAETEVKKEMA